MRPNASAIITPTVASFESKKPASKKDDAQRRQQQSDTTKPLRKELEKIDARMQSLSAERDNLQAALATTNAPADMAQSGKRLKVIDTELGTLEERWLELTEQIETSLA